MPISSRRKHVEVKELRFGSQDSTNTTGQKGRFGMNASQATLPFGNRPTPNGEVKPSFRTKTAATRLTPSELAEIETAAESAGKPLSEWLRETALSAARQRPADPAELLLAEVWAVRYVVLSLFQAGALATSEGKALLPESILKIRDRADTRKLQQARKLLAEFVDSEGKGGRSQP
jgi:hypothetical protein